MQIPTQEEIKYGWEAISRDMTEEIQAKDSLGNVGAIRYSKIGLRFAALAALDPLLKQALQRMCTLNANVVGLGDVPTEKLHPLLLGALIYGLHMGLHIGEHRERGHGWTAQQTTNLVEAARICRLVLRHILTHPEKHEPVDTELALVGIDKALDEVGAPK